MDLAKKSQDHFYEFFQQYQMPPELCRCLASTLSIYPPERPSIDELLRYLFPYLLQRATRYYDQQQWERANLWVMYVQRHFDEIRLEAAHENAFLSTQMRQHLLMHFPLYVQTCLIAGNASFQQEQFDSAYQVFGKIHEALDEFRQDYSGQQRNTFLLKIMNNLAACHYKLKRNEEAIHLFETLSTAPGNFGQIIDRNLQVCAA
jgi:tetratricopeptide (TPR) repeat protein